MKKFNEWLNEKLDENFKLVSSNEIIIAGRPPAFYGDEGTRPYVLRSGPKGFPQLPDKKVAMNWGQEQWKQWAGPESRIEGYGARDTGGDKVLRSKDPLPQWV